MSRAKKRLSVSELRVLRAKILTLDLAPAKCSVAIQYRWPRARIQNAAVDYRDLWLLVGSGMYEFCVPTADADTIWHAHILSSTKIYAMDCRRILGRFLHHQDFSGAWGIQDLKQQRERFHKSQRILAELKRKAKH